MWFHPIDPERGEKDFDDGSTTDSQVQGLRKAVHATESEDRSEEGCDAERGSPRARLRLCFDGRKAGTPLQRARMFIAT